MKKTFTKVTLTYQIKGSKSTIDFVYLVPNTNEKLVDEFINKAKSEDFFPDFISNFKGSKKNIKSYSRVPKKYMVLA
jgi:hypothetical protein